MVQILDSDPLFIDPTTLVNWSPLTGWTSLTISDWTPSAKSTLRSTETVKFSTLTGKTVLEDNMEERWDRI